jgi:hypothetical protein
MAAAFAELLVPVLERPRIHPAHCRNWVRLSWLLQGRLQTGSFTSGPVVSKAVFALLDGFLPLACKAINTQLCHSGTLARKAHVAVDMDTIMSGAIMNFVMLITILHRRLHTQDHTGTSTKN